MFRTTGFVLFVTLLSGSAEAQSKKRVAVMNFDYATVQSGVAAMFGSNQDVGKGIADLLVDKLVQDGTLSVIERKLWPGGAYWGSPPGSGVRGPKSGGGVAAL